MVTANWQPSGEDEMPSPSQLQPNLPTPGASKTLTGPKKKKNQLDELVRIGFLDSVPQVST